MKALYEKHEVRRRCKRNILSQEIGQSSHDFRLYGPCTGVEKKILKEIHQFYTLYPKITPLGVGGHEIYNFLSPYPTDATYQIWLR